jgi:nucleoside-triphosphatase THEP1
MARHIFLTGEKQIGKSTLLKKVLDKYAGDAAGFFTVRTNEFLKDGYSVHMFGLDEEAVPGENNLLFVCGKPNEHMFERFDRMGCEVLSKCVDSSLTVMDELGPHEVRAELFHKAVLRLLDGNVPILGVLQAPAESFWPDIVEHPQVQIIEINEHNRDDSIVIDDILSILTNANS